MISVRTITLALGLFSSTSLAAPITGLSGLALPAKHCLAVRSEAGFLKCVNEYSAGELSHAVQRGGGGPCYATTTATGLTCLDELTTPDAVVGTTETTTNPVENEEDEIHTQLKERAASVCVAVTDDSGLLKCSENAAISKRAGSACAASTDATTGLVKCIDDTVTKRSANMCMAVTDEGGILKCAEPASISKRAGSACIASTDATTGLIKCIDSQLVGNLPKRSSSECAFSIRKGGVMKCIKGITRRIKRSAAPKPEPEASAAACLVTAKTTEGLMSCLEDVDKREAEHFHSKRSSSGCTAIADESGAVKCLESF